MTMSSAAVSKNKSRSKKRKEISPSSTIKAGDVETRPPFPNGFDLGIEGLKVLRRESPATAATFKVPLNSDERERRKERKERFSGSPLGSGTSPRQRVDPLYMPLSSARGDPFQSLTMKGSSSQSPLVGENQNLEKPYLRLTTFPRKEDVRPLKVLIKSLAHVKSRYVQDEDFEWANEQLKSVRQDMTVQRIRSRFVLDVYETHARILLEHGDLDEFNQCQAMIRSLTGGTACPNDASVTDELDGNSLGTYSSNRGDDGFDVPLLQCPESADEFRGYSILYALVRNSSIELKTELARAKAKHSSSSACHATSSCFHAVSVVKAVNDNDYRTFFRLYESAPHMSAYLMDFLVKRVRDRAYERIVSAYRPNVNVEYFRECLRFADLEETRRFLKQSGAVFVDEAIGPPFWVDCKASTYESSSACIAFG